MDHNLFTQYLILFTVTGAVVLRLPKFRLHLFLITNLLFVGFVWKLRANSPHLIWLSAYIFFIVGHYYIVKYLIFRNTFLTWVGILSPILFLFSVRALPISTFSIVWKLIRFEPHQLDSFIGLSYMSFRLSFVAQEVKNKSIKNITLLEYLCFSFFGPAILLGPITSGKVFISSLRYPKKVPLNHALLKIIVGFTKYLFLGSILVRVTLEGIFTIENRPRHLIDFIFGGLMAYPYLYCNFSGFCDIVAGCGQLLGLEVSENFNNPFAARNVKEFWQRWHITLGDYLKNILFNPLSKALVYLLGTGKINLSIVITVLITFIFIGVWHGIQSNYIIFGLLNGVAVAFNHLYTLFLKRTLNKEKLRHYNASKTIKIVSIVLTYIFISITHVIFAYPFSRIIEMWKVVVW